jgi:hypothetical protein
MWEARSEMEEARRQELQMYVEAVGRTKGRPSARTSLMVVVIRRTEAVVARPQPAAMAAAATPSMVGRPAGETTVVRSRDHSPPAQEEVVNLK